MVCKRRFQRGLHATFLEDGGYDGIFEKLWTKYGIYLQLYTVYMVHKRPERIKTLTKMLAYHIGTPFSTQGYIYIFESFQQSLDCR